MVILYNMAVSEKCSVYINRRKRRCFSPAVRFSLGARAEDGRSLLARALARQGRKSRSGPSEHSGTAESFGRHSFRCLRHRSCAACLSPARSKSSTLWTESVKQRTRRGWSLLCRRLRVGLGQTKSISTYKTESASQKPSIFCMRCNCAWARCMAFS